MSNSKTVGFRKDHLSWQAAYSKRLFADNLDRHLDSYFEESTYFKDQTTNVLSFGLILCLFYLLFLPFCPSFGLFLAQPAPWPRPWPRRCGAATRTAAPTRIRWCARRPSRRWRPLRICCHRALGKMTSKIGHKKIESSKMMVMMLCRIIFVASIDIEDFCLNLFFVNGPYVMCLVKNNPSCFFWPRLMVTKKTIAVFWSFIRIPTIDRISRFCQLCKSLIFYVTAKSLNAEVGWNMLTTNKLFGATFC